MSKLSERFKNNIYEAPSSVVEGNNLAEELLEKVNSVPYWNEYTFDEQRKMVRYFVKNSDVEDKKAAFEFLLPCVTGFGELQKLLNNEKVSAVLVNEDMSVHIEIDENVFDTEMILSRNMFQYVLNYVKEYSLDEFSICSNDDKITIRKV